MKKIMLFLQLLLLFSICSAQEEDEFQLIMPGDWDFRTDTSAFYGTTRATCVIGESNNADIPTPMLCISKTDNDALQAYLFYYPVESKFLCNETKFSIKFYNDPTIYVVPITYQASLDRYKINFNSTLTKESFINKLKTSKTLSVSMKNDCFYVEVNYPLQGSKEKIERVEK
jgi:hypothetical protein